MNPYTTNILLKIFNFKDYSRNSLTLIYLNDFDYLIISTFFVISLNEHNKTFSISYNILYNLNILYSYILPNSLQTLYVENK